MAYQLLDIVASVILKKKTLNSTNGLWEKKQTSVSHCVKQIHVYFPFNKSKNKICCVVYAFQYVINFEFRSESVYLHSRNSRHVWRNNLYNLIFNKLIFIIRIFLHAIHDKGCLYIYLLHSDVVYKCVFHFLFPLEAVFSYCF